MSVEAVRNRDGALRRDRDGAIVNRVRWRDETGQARSKVVGKRRDAEAFDAKLKEARRLGGLGLLEAGRETLDEYVEATWALTHAAHLAPKTRSLYAYLLRRPHRPAAWADGTPRFESGGHRTLARRRPRRRRRPGRGRKGLQVARRHPAACGRGTAHSLQPGACRPQATARARRGGPAIGAVDRGTHPRPG